MNIWIIIFLNVESFLFFFFFAGGEENKERAVDKSYKNKQFLMWTQDEMFGGSDDHLENEFLYSKSDAAIFRNNDHERDFSDNLYDAKQDFAAMSASENRSGHSLASVGTPESAFVGDQTRLRDLEVANARITALSKLRGESEQV